MRSHRGSAIRFPDVQDGTHRNGKLAVICVSEREQVNSECETTHLILLCIVEEQTSLIPSQDASLEDRMISWPMDGTGDGLTGTMSRTPMMRVEEGDDERGDYARWHLTL
jgi:hypothetical protein